MLGKSNPVGQRFHDSQPETDPARLIALSDAVYAVSLTLAMGGITPPDLGQQLKTLGAARVLANLMPDFTWLAMNFFLVAVFWFSHHRMFSYVRRVDAKLLRLNAFLLFLIAVMPFAIKLLFSAPPQDGAAVIFYAGFMAATGLSHNMVWKYSTKGRRLVDRDLESDVVRRIAVRSWVSAGIFTISMVVALYDAILARYCWMLLFFMRQLVDRLASTKWIIRLIPAD